MKQLLFLLLFPCLAMAQYQGNGNQKITLGEQTTADGLVWRGVENDTALITPFSDTSAYIILDTINNKFYNYNRSTNVWSLAGGGGGGGGTGTVTSITAGTGLTGGTITTSGTLAADTNFLVTRFDTASMLLPYWQSGRFSGVLPVANGGTNTSTAFTQGSVVFAGASGTYTQNNSQLFFDNTNNRLNIGQNAVISSSPVTKLSLHNGGILLSDSEVNHGMTVLAPTNTFFSGVKGNADHGGAFFRGLNDSTLFSALGFEGINYNGSTTTAAVNFRGAKKSGASYNVLGPNEMVINFENLSNSIMSFLGNGNVGIGTITPTAALHLKAGTASASSAPLKFTSGTNLTTAEAGAMEFNGTNLFFSPSTTRHTVNHGLTGSATLDFPNTSANTYADLTISITGAALSDVVSLGIPNASMSANNITYTAWVSAANTVTVRFANHTTGSIDPASGTFKVFVTK